MKIALTGGIACGKSLVAKFLNEFGVATIDADDIVHELIPPEERKRLARIVFNDPVARRELESRIHPIVKARIQDFLSSPNPQSPIPIPHSPFPIPHSLFPLPPSPLRLAVVPLLFEAHWDAEYDIICCVASKRETQISRMMTTRGYSRDEAEARLAAQMPVEEKALKSHYVIDNDGSAQELKLKVGAFVEWLKDSTAPEDNR